MAYLTWVFRILLFLVLLAFAVRNVDVVHVHGFLDYEWQAPLVLVMLAALVAGVVIGVAGTLRTALFLGSRSRQQPQPADVQMGPPAPAGLPPVRAARERPDLGEGA